MCLRGQPYSRTINRRRTVVRMRGWDYLLVLVSTQIFTTEKLTFLTPAHVFGFLYSTSQLGQVFRFSSTCTIIQSSQHTCQGLTAQFELELNTPYLGSSFSKPPPTGSLYAGAVHRFVRMLSDDVQTKPMLSTYEWQVRTLKKRFSAHA